MEEKGTISVNTENIFPIIKKFLYSDHEIFLRELVSNAVDATQKLEKLAAIGELEEELGTLKVSVSVDKEAKTITVSDQGIGMTAEEIKKYINQVAFSGATEFVEKFKDLKDANTIIGKFGLGFYSAFMVAEKVEILSKSYKKDSQAARWTCEGSTDFTLAPAEKENRGTDVILHINADSEEFLEAFRLRTILEKYGKFLPVEVEFEGNTLNDTAPIWTKPATELTDEDYLKFYKALYPMSEDPLFWIHLNVDYPFNLTGILYFPKVKQDLTMHKDKIQLYSRQVFITDEVKDIVPEFLMLLHGVIDSPDIPLNVSRSYLQSDSSVKKINAYISRKVADKLQDLFNDDRKSYEEKWESIGLFVKYGMISEEKFYEKAKKFALYVNTENQYFTFEEYKNRIAPNQTDKDKKTVFLYSSDLKKQDGYIHSVKNKGYDVLRFDAVLDNHFIGALEQKEQDILLKRVDSDLPEKLVNTGETAETLLSEDQKKSLVEAFKTALGNDTLDVAVEPMSPEDMPVTLILPEFMRRMKEMAALNGMGMQDTVMPGEQQFVLNGNHPLMTKILDTPEADQQKVLIKQLYDLALLAQNQLTGTDLTHFLRRSVDTLA